MPSVMANEPGSSSESIPEVPAVDAPSRLVQNQPETQRCGVTGGGFLPFWNLRAQAKSPGMVLATEG